MALRVDAALTPLANLRRCTDSEGAEVWIAENEDPQFLVDLSAGALDGGWYRLEGEFALRSGGLKLPCLYPDYGTGMSEAERIVLPNPDDGGRVAAVIRLKYRTQGLRLDPSIAPATFLIRRLRLVRLGRVQALGYMVWDTGRDDWRRAGAVLRAFAGPALSGRVREGGEAAYLTYVRGCRPAADDYAEWVRNHDTLTPATIDRMRAQVQTLERRPLVSLILPVYETPERWLRRCLDSVLAQIYPDWELCIADDASPSPHVRRVLDEYRARDGRIRVHYRDRNGHISAASNSALELARGDYVALLDHDDELRPHALLEMVKAFAANPQWRMAYSDEDKIDEQGRRFSPYFKPDWNYELFLAQNCVCHLAMFETALVREVGGFRAGLEGAQDWDLVLRCVERLGDGAIGHVPKVLYHWRAIGGSTAMGVDQKGYAAQAGRRAVAEHLARIGCDARVELNAHGHVDVRRALPATPPRVSLIIPTRDKVELLRMCVGSILERTDYPDYEILVVDNQSSEASTLEYFSEIQADPRVRVLRYDAPFNYSAINNFAAEHASGQVLGLVNNDIEVISRDWLREMVSHAVRPGIGAVGALLFYPDDTIQHAGVILGIGGVAGHVYTGLPRGSAGQCGRALLTQEMSAVTAACLVVRKDVFDRVGGLDEKLGVAFNDIDFCLRVGSTGLRNLWTPHAMLYHHESASRGYEDTPEKLARFKGEMGFMQARWGAALTRDPAYNPNLSLDSSHFDLAFPPRSTAG